MEEPLDETIEQKPKKPRSEAQIKAFELAREKRINNSVLKKEMIAEVKDKIKNGFKELKLDETPKKVVREEEDEVVYVKRKKPKKIIYLESSN